MSYNPSFIYIYSAAKRWNDLDEYVRASMTLKILKLYLRLLIILLFSNKKPLLILFNIFDWFHLLKYNYEIELVFSMNKTYLFTHLDSFFVRRN